MAADLARRVGRTFDLTGKVALVTGSGGPVARAIVDALANGGATVAVHRLPDAPLPTSDRPPRPEAARAYASPLATPEDGGNLVGQVEQDFRGLDIAVRITERPPLGRILDATPGAWERGLADELRATALLARAASDVMIRQGYGGRLVHVLIHPDGPTPRGRTGAGPVLEGALAGLTRALAVELGPHDISANVIVGGPIQAAEPVVPGDAADRRAALDRIPKGRLAHAAEVAALVVYLASEEADFLTGGVYRLDGGDAPA